MVGIVPGSQPEGGKKGKIGNDFSIPGVYERVGGAILPLFPSEPPVTRPFSRRLAYFRDVVFHSGSFLTHFTTTW